MQFQIGMTNTIVFQEAANPQKLIAAQVTEVGRWIHICTTKITGQKLKREGKATNLLN
jgi:hypothetical protein